VILLLRKLNLYPAGTFLLYQCLLFTNLGDSQSFLVE
jgi:hypothetical protein